MASTIQAPTRWVLREFFQKSSKLVAPAEDLHDESEFNEEELSDDDSDYGNGMYTTRFHPPTYLYSYTLSEEKGKGPSSKEGENRFRQAVLGEKLQTDKESQLAPSHAVGRPFRGQEIALAVATHPHH